MVLGEALQLPVQVAALLIAFLQNLCPSWATGSCFTAYIWNVEADAMEFCENFAYNILYYAID